MAARMFQLFWLMVLVGHTILAILWWMLQPGGFPAGHPRFWSNTIAPVAVLGLSLASLWALHRDSIAALRVLLPIWPTAWAAMALSGRILFPISLARLWLAPEGAAAVMALASIPAYSRRPRARERGIMALVGTIVLSAIAGAALAYTQRVPVSATRPLDVPLPELDTGVEITAVEQGAIRLAGNVLIQSSNGAITVPLGRLTLMVDPLLVFSSRSPDGCPTVLVDSLVREGEPPAFRGGRRDGGRSCSLAFDIRGQGPAFLSARAGSDGNVLSVMALTRLDQAVYSHLNSFCDVEIRGHRRLSLEFSPCPGVAIDVQPFDYPIGRPARFAFLDRTGTFRVVEASSGEKGPFRPLASGRLGRDEPLAITLLDQGRPEGRITLADWAQQAGTALSPTAGWGVPVNAIEFSISGDAPAAPASIFVTLAGTSVGRGWDCVGHSAGTYRNRIRFERMNDSETKLTPEHASGAAAFLPSEYGRAAH
jgi:hypothetical protein